MLYTSTIRYRGELRSLDITVKSAGSFGKHFAPTWAMVMGYKKTGDSVLYREQYRDILEHNYVHVKHLADVARSEDIVLKCYCKAGDFCHRVILALYVQDIFKIEYGGEV